MIKNFEKLLIRIILATTISAAALLSVSTLSYAIPFEPENPCMIMPNMPGCPGFIPVIVPPTPTHAPVANNIDGEATVNTDEDTAVSDRSLSGSDSNETHTLTYIKVTDPEHGDITNLNPSTGNFTYVPDLNYFGPDSFTYKVNDGTTDSNTATVSINVASVNDSPVITLTGDSSVNVIINTEYLELGATCIDDTDTITAEYIRIDTADMEGNRKLDTEVLGSYVLEYYCRDGGNEGQKSNVVTRTINVIPVPVPEVVIPAPVYGSLFFAPTPQVSVPSPSTPAVAVNTGGELQVLGVSTSCGISVKGFMRKGHNNDVDSVKKLQGFLNDYLKISLEVSGVFDLATENALKDFQKKHSTEILTPWGITEATGIFYLTTRVVINNIMCPTLKMQMPTVLVPMSLRRGV